MTYATIQTGPHSLAQGVRIGKTAAQTGKDTVSVGYNKYKSGFLVRGKDAQAFIDDQDHDMTPVMHRRDF